MSAEFVRAALDDFQRSVEITRNVRFQANLRLVRRQRASSYIVSLLSLYVIALSLVPNILQLQQWQSQILLACSIILSVFVIFTSLIDGSQNFYHQGELLHQCARKVAAINHRLKNLDVQEAHETAMKDLQELEKEYQMALDDCPINHDNVDYYGEVLRSPKSFPKRYPHPRAIWLYKFFYRVRVFISGNSWLFMHVIAIIIISIIVYKYVIVGSAPFGVSKDLTTPPT